MSLILIEWIVTYLAIVSVIVALCAFPELLLRVPAMALKAMRAAISDMLPVTSRAAVPPALCIPICGRSSFLDLEFEIRLERGSRRGRHSPRTVVEATWTERAHHGLELTLISRSEASRWSRTVSLGSPEFDRVFALTSSSTPQRLRSLFPEVVREHLLLLHDLGFAPRLSVSRRGFVLGHDGWPVDEEGLGCVLELARELTGACVPGLLDGSPAPVESPDITILEESLRQARASCRVCGESLGPDPVSCRLCQQPHHADCWAWVGHCAAYGCGSLEATSTGVSWNDQEFVARGSG